MRKKNGRRKGRRKEWKDRKNGWVEGEREEGQERKEEGEGGHFESSGIRYFNHTNLY